MAISADSIIHYTDTFTKIESILKEGFSIKYCYETLDIHEREGSTAAHPMISFCDIPLSMSFRHFGTYGRYGLGLTKEWAYEMGVNPVLYIDKKSSISKTLDELLADRRLTSSNLTPKQKDNILRIKCFSKNYSGPLKRKKIDTSDYRFYDEREWRLVPESTEINAPFSVNGDNYLTDKKKYNDKIADVRFKFSHKDISYIIVDKTDEIPKVINLLRNEYSNKCTAQELDILFSRICSTEQILSDY